MASTSTKRKAGEEVSESEPYKKIGKAVKKALNGAENGSMSLKELFKELGNGGDKDEFKAALTAYSEKKHEFTIEGKIVKLNLAKKSDSSSSSSKVDSGPQETNVLFTRKDKKVKKSDLLQAATMADAEAAIAQGGLSKGASASSQDLEAIQAWRDDKLVQVLYLSFDYTTSLLWSLL